MNSQLLRTTRENNFEAADWILGLKDEDKEKAKDFILNNGMKSFLMHHKELNLSEFDHEKIEVLKRVMQKYDGDIETINFGDVDDMA